MCRRSLCFLAQLDLPGPKISSLMMKTVIQSKWMKLEPRIFLTLTPQCVKNSVATEDRNTQRSLLGLYMYFCYWQCLTFFLIHPNLSGPPTVIWMTELHARASCRMPDREHSALHSPWWSCLFLRQEEQWKKETHFRKFYSSLSLITPAFVCLRIFPYRAQWRNTVN